MDKMLTLTFFNDTTCNEQIPPRLMQFFFFDLDKN